MSFTVRAKLNPASKEQFLKALVQYSIDTKETMEYVALKQAALICRDAINYTPPFVDGGGGGMTKQAELVGNRAIDRDVNTIFTASNDKSKATVGILLNRLSYAAKTRDRGTFIKIKNNSSLRGISLNNKIAQAILMDPNESRAFGKASNYFANSSAVQNEYGAAYVTDMDAIHARVVSKSRKGRTQITRMQGNYLGKFLVENKSQIKQFVKRKQLSVGRLKSAWWNVMTSLPMPKKKGVDKTFGRKGVTGFVKRFSGNNYYSFSSVEKQVNLIFGNMIGNNDDVASRVGLEEILYAQAMQRMAADVRQMLDRDTNKFNNK